MANKLFSFLDQAAGKAMTRRDRALGIPSDPQVARYESLQPGDFQTIQRVYGADNLARYVETMESRRLKQGGNNG